MTRVTLRTIRRTPGHPLARELIFHIVLFSIKVLKYSTFLDLRSKWRLKDDILSAALGWFAHPPRSVVAVFGASEPRLTSHRWSYGGNRLQIKAETQLLSDVSSALQTISIVGHQPVTSSLKSIQSKQELLNILIQNEHTRLLVWLFPLDHPRRHYLASIHHGRASSTVSALSKHINLGIAKLESEGVRTALR